MLSIAWKITRPEMRYQFSRWAPYLFTKIHQIKNGPDSRVVDQDKELVVEGFPRSANTFVVHGFLLAQDRSVPVAHHLHLPINVIEGTKQDIPCLVLVRRPSEAIASLISSRIQKQILEQGVQISFSDQTINRLIRISARHWIRFYASILPVMEKVLLTYFEEAIEDLEQVITKLNAFFGTNFQTEVQESAVEKKIVQDFGPLFSPDRNRDEIKERVSLETTRGKAGEAIDRAENLYIKWFKG